MTKAAYSNKELSLALQKKGIEAHRVMRFEKGGGWYYQYTFDIICRWLREVHGLHIYTFRLGEKWHYEIQVFKEGYTYSKVGGDSHDEAVEEAIWYCIDNLDRTMKVNELTGKILLSNGFKETENDVYECFLQASEPLDTGDTDVYYRRLYMYYNYLECRWSVWYIGGEGKRHLGYCKTVEQLNKLLQKNKIKKEIEL